MLELAGRHTSIGKSQKKVDLGQPTHAVMAPLRYDNKVRRLPAGSDLALRFNHAVGVCGDKSELCRRSEWAIWSFLPPETGMWRARPQFRISLAVTYPFECRESFDEPRGNYCRAAQARVWRLFSSARIAFP